MINFLLCKDQEENHTKKQVNEKWRNNLKMCNCCHFTSEFGPDLEHVMIGHFTSEFGPDLEQVMIGPQQRQLFEKAYKTGPLLGKGGFGTVYAGERIKDSLPVAIKVIKKVKIKRWCNDGHNCTKGSLLTT